MSAVERVARAICEVAATDEYDHLIAPEKVARTAIAAIRPMDAETERAVALASCGEIDCDCAAEINDGGTTDEQCEMRTRLTVDALVKAMEGKDGD